MKDQVSHVDSISSTERYARLIRIKEVIHKTGLSRSKVYNLITEGRFPAPVKCGERLALWPEDEVDQWINVLIDLNRREAV